MSSSALLSQIYCILSIIMSIISVHFIRWLLKLKFPYTSRIPHQQQMTMMTMMMMAMISFIQNKLLHFYFGVKQRTVCESVWHFSFNVILNFYFAISVLVNEPYNMNSQRQFNFVNWRLSCRHYFKTAFSTVINSERWEEKIIKHYIKWLLTIFFMWCLAFI